MSDTGSPAPDVDQQKLADITYKFCTECSNLLYPKEDRATSTLLYFCKTCKHVEQSESACAWRNQLNSAVTATAGEIEDVASDPTVGAPSASSSDEEPMLWFCTMCGNELRCEECGEAVAKESDTTESLPRKMDVQCPYCDNMETVYFQSQQRAEDTGMKLFYVCLHCNRNFDTVSDKEKEGK